jgi:hypothetical protein
MYGYFSEGGGVSLLEELNWEGSAPAACAAGLFSNQTNIFYGCFPKAVI